jgi:hypothetical protein
VEAQELEVALITLVVDEGVCVVLVEWAVVEWVWVFKHFFSLFFLNPVFFSILFVFERCYSLHLYFFLLPNSFSFRLGHMGMMNNRGGFGGGGGQGHINPAFMQSAGGGPMLGNNGQIIPDGPRKRFKADDS